MPALPLPRRFTIAERVAQYGVEARARLAPYFVAAHVPYPPSRVALVGLKQERELQVYVAGRDGAMRWLRSYPVLAASGRLGPKLRAGDQQVPEGVYAIESLNPNSRFHLSLRVGYPNAFDLAQAMRDGRDDLGGDIMIHGADLSIGCLAMGDEAAEDLFVLVADVSPENVDVILSPVDFRTHGLPRPDRPLPPWVDGLYADIRTALAVLPPPPPPPKPKQAVSGRRAPAGSARTSRRASGARR
jgi:L,D-transpeptidase-like protein